MSRPLDLPIFIDDDLLRGKLGRLLNLMREIDHNGLSSLLDPLRHRQ